MSKPFGRSLLLATTLGFSSLAFAAAGVQPGAPATSTSSGSMHHGKWQGMHHRGNHRGYPGGLDKLDLTDSQRDNIQQMKREGYQQARPEKHALQQKRAAFESTTPDSSEFKAAASELATAEANAARRRVTLEADLRTKIYAVLTPEQRTKLASLRTEYKGRMEKRRTSHAPHPAAAPAPASSTR